MKFENHANMLSPEDALVERGMQQMNLSDEPQMPSSSRLEGSDTKALRINLAKRNKVTKKSKHLSAADFAAAAARPRADQFCVYNTSDDVKETELRTAAFIVEYKPPHKLTLGRIYEGLEDMELKDVIKRNKQEDSKATLRRLVAAVITQAYSYMVKLGLEYGYVCTGQAFIFLRIPDDPTTVYYFLSVPNGDVKATTGWKPDSDQLNRLHLTAIGQVLAFALQALRTPPRDQTWRTRAENQLKTWEVVYEDILEAVQQKKPPPSSEYRPPSRIMQEYLNMSPVRRSARIKSASVARGNHGLGDVIKEDDDDDDSLNLDTPSRRPPLPKSLPQRSAQASATASQNKPAGRSDKKGKSRQYCSQRCLLGLVNRGPLDMGCPNVLDHGTGRHSIGKATFLKLMHKQLSKDMDTDCESVGVQGARGALLKITLTLHGYTVAAKCTVVHFVPHLKHEAAVYKKLRPIQGIHIPVYLGNLDLDRPYFYDGMAKLVHMMFLSYGGTCLIKLNKEHDRSGLVDQARISIEAIHRLGVLHKDSFVRNMLWNPEVDRVMMIDFERSEIVKNRRALGEISSNRKRRLGMRKSPSKKMIGNKRTENENESEIENESEKEKEKEETSGDDSNVFSREVAQTIHELTQFVRPRTFGP